MVEIISGYEGTEVDKFIELVKEIWKKQGSKVKGAENRYQIITGFYTDNAALVPTVTTRRGTEIVIAFNLEPEDRQKIEKAAKGIGLSVSSRPYLWFDDVPLLPPSKREPPNKTEPES
ncbi:hypothetical protein AMJ50_00140 [Parcubacteria bacterium DG_74_3]|nr:MAG: hypothetical protein AMJ50_00140 [Parcubacteria bacterium DG_74_3]